jgi:hypothetical protein
VYALAKENRTARLFMTAPGVGAITALSVASAYDDPGRFARSASTGAYFGLTPRRYESGEVSRNGHVSKRGNRMTRTHLYEAANVILTRGNRFSTLKAWGLRLAKASGFKRAKVAVARKLAVILHAMWKLTHRSATALKPPDLSLPSVQPFPRMRPRRDAWRGSGRSLDCGASATAHTTSADPTIQRQHAAAIEPTPERTLSPASAATKRH